MNIGPILRKPAKIIVLIMVLTVIFAVGYSYLLLKGIEKRMQFDLGEASKIKNITVGPKEGEPVYLLLIGADRRPTWNVSRADTIMILRVDRENKTLHLLSIPRDSRVKIPGHGLDKINHALAYGGASLLIKTVTDYTGLKIHHYMQIDFEGFSEAVDTVGGIYFDTGKSRDDRVPIIPYRDGSRKMDGKEALAFLRARNYPDGDFTRIEHQQQFILEALRQIKHSYTDIPKLTSVVAKHAKTSMGVDDMIGFGRIVIGNNFKPQTATIPGKMGTMNGISYVFPDKEARDKLIEDMKEGRNFSRQL